MKWLVLPLLRIAGCGESPTKKEVAPVKVEAVATPVSEDTIALSKKYLELSKKIPDKVFVLGDEVFLKSKIPVSSFYGVRGPKGFDGIVVKAGSNTCLVRYPEYRRNIMDDEYISKFYENTFLVSELEHAWDFVDGVNVKDLTVMKYKIYRKFK